jgi:putative tryptophan/tyrosine transport system substrate-binding protein
MRRRTFIGALASTIGGFSLQARAQEYKLVSRIGVLTPWLAADRERQVEIDSFRDRLLDQARAANHRIEIVERWAAGDADGLANRAIELAELRPEVLVGFLTPVVAALQRASRTIPIVFANAQNPVGSGFAASLARPGGNITGFIALEPTMGGKWLETLREIAPNVMQVGTVYNPDTHTGQHFESINAAAQSLGITLIELRFRNAADIQRGITTFARLPNCGLLILPDSSTSFHRNSIIEMAVLSRLPAIYPYRIFMESGALAYYGSDTRAQYRLVADYVIRILKGEKPGDLPIQAPTKFELVISLQAAKRIGIQLSPTLLARADEVIE